MLAPPARMRLPEFIALHRGLAHGTITTPEPWTSRWVCGCSCGCLLIVTTFDVLRAPASAFAGPVPNVVGRVDTRLAA